jgi:hypothetical protein
MAKKEKGKGGSVCKRLPTKNEVKDINKKLYKIAEDTDKFNNSDKRNSDRVYANSNEIVTNSVFKETSAVAPSGKTIDLENEIRI